jgi:riboflavin kinase/FMN adenylyltransferase
VVPGDGRGRLIGIPTANLDVWEERALPKAGVYVCKTHALDQKWNSVANVGYRPTFESAPVKPRVEAHLLDFGQNLYGETISLDFVHRLRDEQKFDSVERLIEQIHQDIARTRQLLFE